MRTWGFGQLVHFQLEETEVSWRNPKVTLSMHTIHREAEGSKAKTPPANTKRMLVATVKKVNKAVT